MLVLALAGVPPDDIAEDYALSNERIPDAAARRVLRAHGTTPAAVLAEVLAGLDAGAT